MYVYIYIYIYIGMETEQLDARSADGTLAFLLSICSSFKVIACTYVSLLVILSLCVVLCVCIICCVLSVSSMLRYLITACLNAIKDHGAILHHAASRLRPRPACADLRLRRLRDSGPADLRGLGRRGVARAWRRLRPGEHPRRRRVRAEVVGRRAQGRQAPVSES